ncbi:MAG: hypothetical protein LUG45_02085 [Clostridiales bacterium]|nr:hypothetical protein [Clostridiales bacterium]
MRQIRRFPLHRCRPGDAGGVWRAAGGAAGGDAHCRYPLPFLEAQQALSLSSGGGLYTVTAGDALCLAATEGGDGGVLVLRELLGPEGAAPAAASALTRALGRDRWLLHAPGQGEPFGVVKWLGEARLAGCYLGLSL